MSYAKHHSAKERLQQLNSALERYPGWIDAQLSHIADLVLQDAQDNAKKRTGRMANMTVKRPIKKGSEIGYEVVGTAPYTVFQHEGTRYMKGDPYIQNALNKHASKVNEIDFAALFSGGSKFSSGW